MGRMRSPDLSGREFLKDTVRLRVDFSRTAQNRGLPPPPIEKPCPAGALRTALAPPGRWKGIAPVELSAAIAARRSRRSFSSAPLSLDELSFLLWAAQGMTELLAPGTARRTVPSAGCRHALETYVCALRVRGLEEGIHRYLPLEHELCLERRVDGLPRRLAEAALGQGFLARAAAVLVWTAVPARMEWRYGEASYKVIALDAGHVCQNLYLACAAVGAGTCAVAAYRQDLLDGLLGVDGGEEFAVYLAPVGKVGGAAEG